MNSWTGCASVCPRAGERQGWATGDVQMRCVARQHL